MGHIEKSDFDDLKPEFSCFFHCMAHKISISSSRSFRKLKIQRFILFSSFLGLINGVILMVLFIGISIFIYVIFL